MIGTWRRAWRRRCPTWCWTLRWRWQRARWGWRSSDGAGVGLGQGSGWRQCVHGWVGGGLGWSGWQRRKGRSRRGGQIKELAVLRRATLGSVGQTVDGRGGMVVDGIARCRVGFASREVYAPALEWMKDSLFCVWVYLSANCTVLSVRQKFVQWKVNISVAQSLAGLGRYRFQQMERKKVSECHGRKQHSCPSVALWLQQTSRAFTFLQVTFLGFEVLNLWNNNSF